MFSRRKFLKSAALTGAGLLVRPLVKNTDSVQAADLPAPIKQKTILFQTQPSLDPTIIPKYVTPLVIPPAMPKTPGSNAGVPSGIDYYEIAVRQFSQQILPTGFNATTVWSYGSANHPTSFNYPAFTIEA
ncbi:MAG: twin-arginine translocation signal domain-containing protein, partial [Chloroflexi bacterium]